MKTSNFYREFKEVVTRKRPLTLDEFKEALLQDKPKELFSSEYSREKPLYVITKIDEIGVEYYCTALVDKTPATKTHSDFHRYVLLDGGTNIYWIANK